MTVVIHIGRRVPRKWFKRTATKLKGIITFQEHMWTIIKQSMSLAKRKASADGRLKFVIKSDKEIEDIEYQIEWMIITIQGTKKQEEEEYNEAKAMYSSLGTVLKKEMPSSDKMKEHFKSRVLASAKVQDAYKQGYGAMEDNNIANKLLEMGILTHIEWHKDFDSREPEIPS